MRLLSTQEPTCSTGGMPTASHISRRPCGQISRATSGVIRPVFATAWAAHPVITTRQPLAMSSRTTRTWMSSDLTPGVVAAHHADDAADATVDDGVVQGR